jgi:hypothetical protein
MIVVDFESLPDALLADTVTMLAPAIRAAENVNCFVDTLYVNAAVELPLSVTAICEDEITFNTIAFTAALFVDVLKGFTVGDVIVTTGAGLDNGCE